MCPTNHPPTFALSAQGVHVSFTPHVAFWSPPLPGTATKIDSSSTEKNNGGFLNLPHVSCARTEHPPLSPFLDKVFRFVPHTVLHFGCKPIAANPRKPGENFLAGLLQSLRRFPHVPQIHWACQKKCRSWLANLQLATTPSPWGYSEVALQLRQLVSDRSPVIF